MAPGEKHGPQSLVPHETLLQKMLQVDIFDEYNILQKRGDDIWKEICKALNDNRPQTATFLLLAVKKTGII